MDMEIFRGFEALPVENSEGVGLLLILQLIAILMGLLITTVFYVLQSVGFYSIAKRRGIHNPWLAWIPVANMWIMGSISDQYQFVTKGRVKNRRKTLLGLQIAMSVCCVLIFVLAFVLGITTMQAEMTEMSVNMDMGLNVNVSNANFGVGMVGIALLVVAVYLVLMVIAIVLTVFQYIAAYDLFVSCSPNNGVLFLVLSILFNTLMPIFIFALRNKDDGMPPRRVQIPVAPWTPAPPPPAPAWQQPATEPQTVNPVAEEEFVQPEEPEA